jgi:hypothetical protein
VGFLAIAAPIAVGLALASPGPAAIATPRGWTVDAEPRARARVSSWLGHDARALVVLSPGTIDDFAEALAVIELQGAFDLEVPRADELRRALPARLGTLDDATVEIDPIDGAPASVRGRGKGGGHVFEAVLVPSGSTRKLVVLEVREGEEALYRGTMDAALAGLTGIAEPMRPFAVAPWRWTAILGWLVVTAGALAVGLVRRPFGADARAIGRVLALGCLVAALITAALVWTPLHDRTLAMQLAGITPGTLALEIAGYGLVAAIVCWLVGAIAGRGEAGWVQSAPRTGVFADKSLSMPRVPIVPGPGARLAHPDGAGNLEDQPHGDAP